MLGVELCRDERAAGESFGFEAFHVRRWRVNQVEAVATFQDLIFEVHLSVPDTPINPEATATEDAFARFRFAGGRFDSHTIPLEVLPDLAAYRKLVIEVAKMIFRMRMGTRVRVPKGFEDSLQIGLARIEGGRSAVAYMPRLRPVAAPPPQQPLNFAANQPAFGQTQYPDFDDARDYIDNLIDSVGSTGSVPQEFPVELAGFFNSFGQSLHEDEFIELGFGGAKPVRYDTFIRKKIVLSRETTYENAVDAQFVLNGGVVAQGAIHVLDVNGGASISNRRRNSNLRRLTTALPRTCDWSAQVCMTRTSAYAAFFQ